MKNFLIVLLLLIVAGFVFLFLKPDHDLSQKVFGYLNVTVSKNLEVEIDLTDCLTYFDWCNTCMVEDGEIQWCTKMFCDSYQEPMCLEYEWTGMDLTDCLSYFDWCNTCTVENGRPLACTLMYCETPTEPECLKRVWEEEELDLTNCLSYFDWCNNCSVENGEIWVCTELFCEEHQYQEARCTQYISETISLEESINIDAIEENENIEELF